MNRQYFQTIGIISLMILILPAVLSSQENLGRNELIQAALDRNSDLGILASREKQAGYGIRSARAGFFPDINFSAGAAYISNPDSYTINAGDFFSGEIVPGAGNILMPDSDYTVEFSGNHRYEITATIEQPVYTWGKLSNSLEAAEIMGEGAILESEIKRDEIITRIDIILHRLSGLKRLEEESRSQINVSLELTELVRQNYENGFILHSELLLAEARVKETEMVGLVIEDKIKQLLIELENITDTENLELENLTLPEAASWDEFCTDDEERLKLEALKENRSLDLLELAVSGVERKLAISRGSGPFRPDIGIFAEFSLSASAFPFLESDWMSRQNPGMLISIGVESLIYDGGASAGNIGSAEEELEQAVLELEKGKGTITELLSRLLYRMKLTRHRIDYLKIRADAGEAVIKQKEDARDAGYGEERDVLTEKITLHTIRMNMIEEEISLAADHFQLLNLLGRDSILPEN